MPVPPASPTRRLRVAVTLEQCWHRVPGGTASSAIGSARAIAARGDVDQIGVAARHGGPPPEAWRPPIEVRHLPLPRLALYEAWHRFRRPAVERATGPVDVIHVTGMAMPPRSAPMVVTVHDLAFLHDPSTFTPRGVRFFTRAIELARRDADVVVCPSAATLEDCVDHGFERDRLRLVPWGVDAAPADPDAVAAVRARFGLGDRFILWQGVIEPRKNVPSLLRAFARLERDDVELVLAGPEGWNDELAALEAQARGRVRRLGFVANEDLGALHAAATAFCFPSWREGFGLPVLEAMAQGTPVVTSAGTATAEVVGTAAPGEDPAGLLVDPGDAHALADALASLLDDPDRAATIGAAGARRARTYTWARTAELLVAAYREVAE